MKNHFAVAIVIAIICLVPVHADAQTEEVMSFSYDFLGLDSRPWSVGARLEGEIMGYIDPTDATGDRVIITEFLNARLIRPGFPVYEYETANAEFNSIAVGGGLLPPTDPASMTFSGTENNFRYCQRGFVFPPAPDVPIDCGFGAPGEGGFGYTNNISPSSGGWVSAADGDTPLGTCLEYDDEDPPNIVRDWPGCRATDTPYEAANWNLTRLDPDQDGIRRDVDNCPSVANADQTDNDANGYGDVCELGTTQDFGDGGDPFVGNGFFCFACLVNGWTGESSLDTGDAGAGDHTLVYEATGGGFHALTWEHYGLADVRFHGDYITYGVSALRFKAQHSGIGDPVMLRAFIFDTFDDGTTDALISNSWADIQNTPPGTDWNTYEIPLDPSVDLTPWVNNTNTLNDILSAVAQLGLRHDPGGEGPGDSDPITATVFIDDIQLIIDADLDDDGIANEIDTMRLVASSGFDDGTTSGTVTDPGDQALSITDEPAPGGVRIAADPAGGPGAASVSVCNGAATLSFNASDDTLVTCTSVQVIVIAGEIEMQVVVNGQPATVTVPANNELTFQPGTSTFSAPATNPDPVVVEIAGSEVTIEPGETFDVEPFRRFSAKLEIDDDEFELEGDFKLGANTDGINPRRQEVTISVGGLSLTIPAKSFDKDGGDFEFEGDIDGVELEVQIERIRGKKYKFEIEAEADIGGGSGPVEFTLLIGNDTGTISVTPDYDD